MLSLLNRISRDKTGNSATFFDGPDRRKDGGVQVALRGVEETGAGAGVAGGDGELEHEGDYNGREWGFGNREWENRFTRRRGSIPFNMDSQQSTNSPTLDSLPSNFSLMRLVVAK